MLDHIQDRILTGSSSVLKHCGAWVEIEALPTAIAFAVDHGFNGEAIDSLKGDSRAITVGCPERLKAFEYLDRPVKGLGEACLVCLGLGFRGGEAFCRGKMA